MPFEPDILVTAPDETSPALVAEVKFQLIAPAEAEEKLKRYMVRMRCPVGLLATPEKLLIYRDMYTGYDESSVERVGEFSMAGVLDPDRKLALEASSRPELHEFLLEEAVQRWLEGLINESALRALPPGLREA